MRRAAMLFIFIFSAGCAHFPMMRAQNADPKRPEVELASHAEEVAKHPIYVVSNGFHTGIIFRASDLPHDVWPEVDSIPEHPYVEVGWGSEIFYRAKSITPGVVLGAAVPNPSVLHVVGWDRTPEELFDSDGDLIRLEVDDEELRALCQHIHDSYERDSEGFPINLGRGIYGDGWFFRARGKYYFPNTCNVWTARGLKQAGVPIVPEMCGMADAVLLATGRVGTTIRRR